jgi:sec-independent protein translocase protein TatB
MEFLGVGPLELLFIFLIALIVLGPKDIVKAGRTLGRFLNRVVTSPTWRAIKETSSEMRTLPSKLMREAGIEEEIKQFQDINRNMQDLKKTSSFNLQDIGKEAIESIQDFSNQTIQPDNQQNIQTSPGDSKKQFSSDVNDHSFPSDNPKESEASSKTEQS